jgi:hypothetical protein
MSSDPYPYAIDEAFDTYKVLVESGEFLSLCTLCFTYVINLAVGGLIGMSGKKLNIMISGDSA